MGVVRQCIGLPGVSCARLVTTKRCPEHSRQYEQQRGRRTKGRYDAAYRRLREQAIREHPWCGVCGHPGTPDNPLTGDHVIPIAHGGRNVKGNVAVLCRACNSRKGARITQ